MLRREQRVLRTDHEKWVNCRVTCVQGVAGCEFRRRRRLGRDATGNGPTCGENGVGIHQRQGTGDVRLWSESQRGLTWRNDEAAREKRGAEGEPAPTTRRNPVPAPRTTLIIQFTDSSIQPKAFVFKYLCRHRPTWEAVAFEFPASDCFAPVRASFLSPEAPRRRPDTFTHRRRI